LATGDNAPPLEIRACQRILASLGDQALAGQEFLDLPEDSKARTHLLRSLSLRELKRDQLAFYHDALRDWAIASRINEDPATISSLPLSKPVSSRYARGVEIAARMALERQDNSAKWSALVSALSIAEAHSSWRRQAILAVIRSELALTLLEANHDLLLANGGEIFRELCTAIMSVETIPTNDLLQLNETDKPKLSLPGTLRSNITGSALRLLRWTVSCAREIPLVVIPPVVDLVGRTFQHVQKYERGSNRFSASKL